MSCATTYRAMICDRLEGPDSLQLADLPRQPLQSDEVRLEVRAAGVNFPDLLVTRGLYQHKPELPFAPGLEVAGRVLEVGAGVAQWQVGQEVMAGTRFSGFAAELVVAASAVQALPGPFAVAQGACFLVAARTAYHALVDKAGLAPGETLVVLGAGGGVGLATVELGKLLGARVVAVASRDEGLAAALARGADQTINHSRQDLRQRLLELTEGRRRRRRRRPGGRPAVRRGIAHHGLGRAAARGGLRQRRHSLAQGQPAAGQGLQPDRHPRRRIGATPSPPRRRRHAALAGLVRRGPARAPYFPPLSPAPGGRGVALFGSPPGRRAYRDRGGSRIIVKAATAANSC